MNEAETDFGIASLLIPSLDREAPASAGLEMMELMLKAVMTILIFHLLLDGQKLASG